jgi:predicted TPR repeat methyltransferase
LADESGFQVALTKPVNIRKEKNGWIEGDLFVLQAR